MITQSETYNVAKLHGFQDYFNNPLYIPTKLALIISECCEALEAHRQRHDEELGHELADIVIRTMDLSESLGIDLQKEIENKHNFNKNRPFKHGNKRY